MLRNDLVRGEHDANAYSKPWTPSEQVAIAEALRAEMGNTHGGNRKIQGQNFGLDKHQIAERSGFGNAPNLCKILHKLESVRPTDKM